MPPLAVPASMPSDGTLKVTYHATMAGAAPSVAVLNAGVELSCYLTSDGWNPTTEEAEVVDSRLCSKQDFAQPGRVTESLDIKYVFNTVTIEDLARTTLARGVVGFITVRWGLDADLPYAATTQKVDVYPIKTGVQKKMPPEQNSVHRIDQKVFITGNVLRDVTLLV